jgi:hypothetical protein
MSTLVTTADVDAADRFDFIRELTATMWVPMEADPAAVAGQSGPLSGLVAGRQGVA